MSSNSPGRVHISAPCLSCRVVAEKGYKQIPTCQYKHLYQYLTLHRTDEDEVSKRCNNRSFEPYARTHEQATKISTCSSKQIDRPTPTNLF